MDKKMMIGIVVLILLVFVFLSANNKEVTGKTVIEQDVKNLHETSLAIENMYCEACAYGVKAQIEELDGVVNADINYKTASGVVLYDADRVDAETIAAASTVYPANVLRDKVIND